MKIISVFNNKGGTGKTTTSINVGAILQQKGFKVLLVDLDPQGNLTKGLGLESNYTILSALNNKEIDINKLSKYKSNLSVLCSSDDLLQLNYFLDNQTLSKEKKIKNLFNIEMDFDFVIFDCPPTFSISVLNALFASDYYLTPMEADYFSQIGLNKIISVVNDINEERGNNQLKCLGLFFTCYTDHITLSNSIKENINENFPSELLKTNIRQNIKLREAQIVGEDIVKYDTKCNGYIDYLNLTNEILNKINNNV